MSKHLHRDLESVQREILSLSAIVEEMIDQATRALIERDSELARSVVASDEEVDRREVHIEEQCLKMLALHQPVAVDLRRVATVMKVNNDLERIADLAVNIAERTRALADRPDFRISEKLQQMVSLATRMVREVLDAFVNFDSQAARAICALDDEVDCLNVEMIYELQEAMRSDPHSVEPALQCFSVSRHIERIADHATNIAEDVIYLVEGEIVRHQHDVDQLVTR